MSQSSNMTYAQALLEAKQVIVQQQVRIKADAERIRQQQQTIVDQSASIGTAERKIAEQAAELARIAGEMESMAARVEDLTSAREQADAVVNRQGQRITGMQESIERMQRTTMDQEARIAELTAERDGLRAQLPSRDDADALSQMSELLAMARRGSSRRGGEAPTMRIAGTEAMSSASSEAGEGYAHAQAA